MENKTIGPGNYINPIKNEDVILTITFSTLSILGAVAVIIDQCRRYKKEKISEYRHLLIWLTFADMGNAVGMLMGAVRFQFSDDRTVGRVLACHTKEEMGCLVQSFITTLFSMSSFFWTTFIAFHLWWTFDNTFLPNCRRIVFVAYHIAGWGIPGKSSHNS